MADQDLVKRPEAGALARFDYGEDANAGWENTSGEDFAIPFLSLLQDISPQVTEKTVDGAASGAFLNTVSAEVYGDEVLFVPALTEHLFVEWRPRAQGGGFVARLELDSDIVKMARAASQKFGSYKNGDTGNDLVETFYVYGIVVSDDRCDPVLLACTSTKIGAYKRWISRLRMTQIAGPDGKRRTPPLFAYLTKIRSTRIKNAKGTFWNLVLEPAGKTVPESLLAPDDPRFVAAKGVRELVVSGRAKIDYTAQEPATAEGGDVAF
jgi:hypothetical protein